ncbi:hypothetical protein Tco_0865933 [Tanacetum coccineum]
MVKMVPHEAFACRSVVAAKGAAFRREVQDWDLEKAKLSSIVQKFNSQDAQQTCLVFTGTLLTSSTFGGVDISGMPMVETAGTLLISTTLGEVDASGTVMVGAVTDGSLVPGRMNLKRNFVLGFLKQLSTFRYEQLSRFSANSVATMTLFLIFSLSLSSNLCISTAISRLRSHLS